MLAALIEITLMFVKQLLKLARTKRSSHVTVKCRLAGRLGIGLPPAGRQIPTMVKSTSSSGFIESRAGSTDVGTGYLSIMGNRDDLDPFRFELYCVHSSGGARPGRARSNDLAERLPPWLSFFLLKNICV